MLPSANPFNRLHCYHSVKVTNSIPLRLLLHILSLRASVIITKLSDILVWLFDCTRGQRVTAAATYTSLICINFHRERLIIMWRKCSNFLWHLLPNIWSRLTSGQNTWAHSVAALLNHTGPEPQLFFSVVWTVSSQNCVCMCVSVEDC